MFITELLKWKKIDKEKKSVFFFFTVTKFVHTIQLNLFVTIISDRKKKDRSRKKLKIRVFKDKLSSSCSVDRSAKAFE